MVGAAAAAVVTVTAAGVVLVGQEPSTTKKITGTDDDAPGLAWSLDAAEYLGRSFADFAAPRTGTVVGTEPGFALFGDVVVTFVGVPNVSAGLDDAALIGVDADTGEVRWNTPVSDVQQCSTDLGTRRLVCYAMDDGYSVIDVDVDSGDAVHHDISESVFAVASHDGVLYTVEGNAEDDDIRVHSGSVDDISSNWTRSFDVGGAWEEVFGSDIVRVKGGVGLLQVGGDAVQFDASDGSVLWQTGSDEYVYGAQVDEGGAVTYTDADNHQVVIGEDGRVLIDADSAVMQMPVVNTNPDAPIIIGDSAYDRGTGKVLWRSDNLVQDDYGTLQAIVGDVAYLSAQGVPAAVDVRTGERLWQSDSILGLNPSAGSGDLLVGSDWSGMTALDLRTGTVAWTIPFDAVDADPEVFENGGSTAPYGDGWIHTSDRRMIGLAPL